MEKTAFEKIEVVKNNAYSWYRWFGPNIYTNLLGRKLYKYSGVMKRAEIRSTKAKVNESILHDGYQCTLPLINTQSLGLVGGYLADYPLFARYSADILEHFDIPVYENIIGALHNSVMGGLTKAEINVTAQSNSDEYTKQFIELKKKETIQQVPIPELAQQVEQQFNDMIQKKDDETFNDPPTNRG